MTAAIFAMEKPRHRMTPEELKKELADVGLSTKEGAIRWQQKLARTFARSGWTQDELAGVVGLDRTRVGQILRFGYWLNGTRGPRYDNVHEKLFRKCSRQFKDEKDDARREVLTTALIDHELAKPPLPKLPKIKPSAKDKVTLESLVKPGRWPEAKILIDAMARIRAQEMTDSMRGFYEKGLAQAKAVKADYDLRSRTLDEIMTQAEFKLIRSCLHSDRQSEAERKKYDRAFEVFNRIEQSIKWN